MTIFYFFFFVTRVTQDWYFTNREQEHRLAHIPVHYNLQFIAHLAHKASLKKVRKLCNTINENTKLMQQS